MKSIFVKDLKAGQAIDDYFVLAEKNMSRKKDGGNYLTIVLSDKTGTVKAVVWDNVEQLRESPAAGDFVRVGGAVSEFRGALQVVVKWLEKCADEAVDPADFIPATRRDTAAMFTKLVNLGRKLENPQLRALLEAFWSDSAFVEKFKAAPAAKHMHHAYLGGLLEHTLSVTLLAERVGEHYSGIDRDLLLTGAILHDIGKIKEFVYDRRIDYSDAGRLVSHIVIGVEMVQDKIAGISGFPEHLAMLVKHLLISHHGERAYGSPEPPKTLEAVLLNYLDEIDAKINGIREFMENHTTDGAWTSYNRPLERFFYSGTAVPDPGTPGPAVPDPVKPEPVRKDE